MRRVRRVSCLRPLARLATRSQPERGRREERDFPTAFCRPSEVLWPEVEYSLAVSFTHSQVSQGCTGTAVLAFQPLNCVTEYGSGFHGRRPAAAQAVHLQTFFLRSATFFFRKQEEKAFSAAHVVGTAVSSDVVILMADCIHMYM